MEKSLELYSLGYDKVKTYIVACAFAVGNIVLPQLFHLIPKGGMIFLPIYFFTLVGAYKYGWKVGLLTAFLSPVANSLLFGMPTLAVLPAILLKSVLLALGAGFVASRCRKATLLLLTAVVLAYQVAGTMGEWAICRDFALAVQDFRIGLPGMALQVIGGWIVINKFLRK